MVCRGIRYGVGQRFLPPVPAPAWQPATLLATQYGPSCPQASNYSGPAMSEDCLVLNVFAPEEAEELWPVMVWIHGGGYNRGSGGDYFYGPELLGSPHSE